jgi:hypothetical protein
LDAATSAANATAGLHKPLIFIFFLVPPVSLQADTNVAAVQTAAAVVVVACVQTVWPQSGALSCDLLTRRICTPTATNSHGLYFFWLFLFFFKTF